MTVVMSLLGEAPSRRSAGPLRLALGRAPEQTVVAESKRSAMHYVKGYVSVKLLNHPVYALLSGRRR